MVSIHNFTNRLGNQLFQIACGIGYAEKHGHKFVLPKFWAYNQCLKKELQTQSFPNTMSGCVVSEMKFSYYELPIITGMNVLIDGYRQSYKYWWENKEEVYKAFRFKDELVNECERVMRPIKNLKKQVVSVHFRFTDYLNLKDYHTCLIDTDYYEKAISQFDKDNTIFFVFSDDLQMAYEYMNKLREKLGISFTTVENTSDVQDLILMSMCDSNIIANSSFSWWGAALNKNTNKKIVAPEKWFGSNYTSQGWDAKDVYLPNTIII